MKDYVKATIEDEIIEIEDIITGSPLNGEETVQLMMKLIGKIILFGHKERFIRSFSLY